MAHTGNITSVKTYLLLVVKWTDIKVFPVTGVL